MASFIAELGKYHEQNVANERELAALRVELVALRVERDAQGVEIQRLKDDVTSVRVAASLKIKQMKEENRVLSAKVLELETDSMVPA